ncbi:RHS repeat domain-containing protein [Pseudoalteromonas luteoviolacea]|uniref:Insecticide toxin TcdB middle/N-terminal domain-containing protein n=1 Tax=Pseudoalteromonas luteoviolacea S4060-1 TaxID=1365257 RepID=A0A162BP73_9GAMM|nr:RHS repeat-associated core domain-containing protein [Pseudoalteromonas luteoviolacea]KZN65017.1 hypothetical protein N478_03145 [Pseudoalteromonas luteoviolacea S4060-1]
MRFASFFILFICFCSIGKSEEYKLSDFYNNKLPSSTSSVNRINSTYPVTETVDLFNRSINLKSRDIDLKGSSSLPVSVVREVTFPHATQKHHGGFIVPALRIDLLEIDYGGLSDIPIDYFRWEHKYCKSELPVLAFTPNSQAPATFKVANYKVVFHNEETSVEFYRKKETNNKFPENADWVSKENWYLSCEEKGVKVYSPNGVVYYLYKILDKPEFKYLAWEVEDYYNNRVSYRYKDEYVSSISSNDGRKLTFEYSDGDPLLNNKTLKSVKHPTGSFDYSEVSFKKGKLTNKIKFDEGEFIEYTTSFPIGTSFFELNFPKTKTLTVRTSGGADIEYQFSRRVVFCGNTQEFKDEYSGVAPGQNDHCFHSSAANSQGAEIYYALSKKTEKLGKLSSYVTLYEFVPQEIESNSKKQRTTLVTYGSHKEKHTFSTILNSTFGNIIDTKILASDDAIIREIKTDYVNETFKDVTHPTCELSIDCKSLFLKSGSQTLEKVYNISRVKSREVIENGNTYKTSYINYSDFGSPEEVHFSGIVDRKVKYEYFSDKPNWWLERPLKTWLYDYDLPQPAFRLTSNINYKTLYANIIVPHQYYSNGLLKKEIEYNHSGMLSKVVLNSPKIDSNENVSVAFSDYRFGIARSITVFDRYKNKELSKSYDVDSGGRITSVTDFDGTTTEYRYDKIGRIIAINYENDFNQNWVDKKFTWSGLNNKRITEHCTLDQDLIECEGDVKIKSEEVFDSRLRLIQRKTVDLTSNSDEKSATRYQNYQYNYMDQQTFSSFLSTDAAELNGVSTKYDEVGRVKQIFASGLGTTFYKYLSGNKIQVTDPLGNITTSTYQAFSEPEYIDVTAIEAPEGVSMTVELNYLGQIKSISQSGSSKDNQSISLVEEYYYDNNQQVCMTSRPDVGNTLFRHNAIGKIVWKKEGVETKECSRVKPQGATEYIYDNLGELHKIIYPPDEGTSDIERILDTKGNLIELNAGEVSHFYGYNNQGLLEYEQLLISGQLPLEIDYGYDGLRNRSYVAYPDGTTIQLSPNGFGEPTRAVVLKEASTDIDLVFAKEAKYHATSRVKEFTFGNGVKHTQEIDANSTLPDIIKYMNGNIDLINLDYDFDSNGNVTSIIDNVSPEFSLNDITYDGLNRLISVSDNNNVLTSTINYDGLGNIESYSSSEQDLTYEYNRTTNQLLSVKGVKSKDKYSSFDYDRRGNTTNNGLHSFRYNLANQLVSAKDNSYLYDGHSRRVKQVEDGDTSYSLYSQDGKLLYRENGEEVSGDGINYIYLGNTLIAKHGSIANKVKDRQRYRPYGESIDSSRDDIGYTGHKYDPDIELSYMQARYYDPVIGRFYSNDPVDSIEHFKRLNHIHGFNRYVYANNNPYKFTDPDGEFAVNFGLAGLGFVVGGVGAAIATVVQTDGEASFKQIAGSFLGGGAVGAAAGFTMGASVATISTTATVKTFVSTTATSGIAGGLGDAIGQAVGNDGQVNIQSSAISAILSTIGGATGASAKLMGYGAKTEVIAIEAVNTWENAIVKPLIETQNKEKMEDK